MAGRGGGDAIRGTGYRYPRCPGSPGPAHVEPGWNQGEAQRLRWRGATAKNLRSQDD